MPRTSSTATSSRRAPEWVHELTLTAEGPPWLSMGVARTDQWLLPPDEHAPAELALRRQLLDERHDDVFAALPGTEAAGLEIVEAIGAGNRPLLPRQHPLEVAGRLVQEDLCILEPRDGRLVLTAAVLCFPSHWRLADKLGRPVAEIHGPVAHYADELAGKVDGFLERMRPDTVVARRNWSIHELPDLYSPVCPPPQHIPPAEQWLRSERQSLRRLRHTGAVVFTIRVQQCQLASLPADVASKLAARLRIESAELTVYKNMQSRKADVVDHLETHAQT